MQATQVLAAKADEIAALVNAYGARLGEACAIDEVSCGKAVLRSKSQGATALGPDLRIYSLGLLAARCACLASLPQDAKISLVDSALNVQSEAAGQDIKAVARIERQGRTVIAIRAEMYWITERVEIAAPAGLLQATFRAA